MTATTDVDPLGQTGIEILHPGQLLPGMRIGGYCLQAVLGVGGMGVVWSAQDPLLARTIAIKVLKRVDAPPALRRRFLREARAMARITHPNVVSVHEIGTEGERDFIAMELVDGETLADWVAGHPPRDEVLAALLAAGRGLAASHAAGIVHRDFKPKNVLRATEGRVLLTDFGISRCLDDAPAATLPTPGLPLPMIGGFASGLPPYDSVSDSPHTGSGAMIGTPAYMAPELYAGAPPDPRSDQFAFCVTAWEALTGSRPYHGRTLEELRMALGAGVAAVATDLPGPIRVVLARGLDPDPAKRWPDLAALLAALEGATRAPAQRWPRILAALAVTGRVAAVARGIPPAGPTLAIRRRTRDARSPRRSELEWPASAVPYHPMVRILLILAVLARTAHADVCLGSEEADDGMKAIEAFAKDKSKADAIEFGWLCVSGDAGRFKARIERACRKILDRDGAKSPCVTLGFDDLAHGGSFSSAGYLAFRIWGKPGTGLVVGAPGRLTRGA